MIAGLLALAISISSVGAIYLSWRQREQRWLAFAGWLLAVASMFVWSWALGPEFGVSYSVIVFVCLIWLQVGVGVKASGGVGLSSQRPYRNMTLPDARNLRKHATVFFLSVPVTGVLSLMTTVAMLIHLPWTLLTKLAVSVFVYPLLWGILSSWICTQRSPGRPAIVLISLSMISSILLWI